MSQGKYFINLIHFIAQNKTSLIIDINVIESAILLNI